MTDVPPASVPSHSARPEPARPEPANPDRESQAPSSTDPDEPYLVIDSRGRRCPLPILDLAKAAATAPAGVVIVVLADDPAAKPDLIAWCRMTGAEFIGDLGAERFAIRTRVTPASGPTAPI